MDRGDRWLSVALRGAPLLLFLWIVRPLLGVVALGALCALLLDPLKRRLSGRGPRLAKVAPMLLTVATLVLIVIPFVLVTARVIASAQAFLEGGLDDVFERLQEFATQHLSGLASRLHLPRETIRAAASNAVQRSAGALAGFVSGAASSLPELLINIFLFVATLYYLLRDGGSLADWIARHSPFPESDTRDLFESIRTTVHGVILGQLATSIVQGTLTLIALYACGVPGALMFGILATLLTVVPLIGAAPVTVGAVIYLLAAGRTGAAVGMAVAAAIIGFSDNIVRPWVQSSRTRIHPLITFLSVFGGLVVLGGAGVFLGPVIAATAIWTVDLYTEGQKKLRAASE